MERALPDRHEDRVEINDQSLLFCPDGSGELIDISIKGLSFHHLTGNNWPTGAFKIDLLLDNSTLLIEQIPCSLLYPEEVNPDNSHRWRHALKFGSLSEEQKIKLQDFIACHSRQQPPLTMI